MCINVKDISVYNLSAATQLRYGGKHYLHFVENIMHFSAVKKCENLLNYT